MGQPSSSRRPWPSPSRDRPSAVALVRNRLPATPGAFSAARPSGLSCGVLRRYLFVVRLESPGRAHAWRANGHPRRPTRHPCQADFEAGRAAKREARLLAASFRRRLDRRALARQPGRARRRDRRRAANCPTPAPPTPAGPTPPPPELAVSRRRGPAGPGRAPADLPAWPLDPPRDQQTRQDPFNRANLSSSVTMPPNSSRRPVHLTPPDPTEQAA
jgi:hypothetical protein